MVKHIVMWRLADQADGRGKAENAAIAKRKLEALKGLVPGLIQAEAGIAGHDPAAGPDEAGWDLVLYTVFHDWRDLAVYRTHPAHLEVAEFMALVRTERAVVDFVV